MGFGFGGLVFGFRFLGFGPAGRPRDAGRNGPTLPLEARNQVWLLLFSDFGVTVKRITLTPCLPGRPEAPTRQRHGTPANPRCRPSLSPITREPHHALELHADAGPRSSGPPMLVSLTPKAHPSRSRPRIRTPCGRPAVGLTLTRQARSEERTPHNNSLYSALRSMP